MLALLSVWTGLASLIVSLAIVIRRSLFTDVWISVAWFSAIASLALAGMSLWDLRKEAAAVPGVSARRTQSFVGIALATISIATIYMLIGMADVVPR